MEWQPIETAPKDGTWFDAWITARYEKYRVADAFWCKHNSCFMHGELDRYGPYPTDWEHGKATHWMPIPAPPAEKEKPCSE